MSDREADRLLIQADQLRLLAEDLEGRAAAIRPERTQLNHRRTFDQLVARDHDGDPESAVCRYCGQLVHPYDPSHRPSGSHARSALCQDVDHLGTDGRCAHIDHVVPHRQNGLNHIDNLVLACRQCNLAKRDRTPMEWLLDESLVNWRQKVAEVEAVVGTADRRLGSYGLPGWAHLAAEAGLLVERVAQYRAGAVWPPGDWCWWSCAGRVDDDYGYSWVDEVRRAAAGLPPLTCDDSEPF